MDIYKAVGETDRERERVGKQFYILHPLHHNITQNWENLRTSKLLSSSSPSGWAEAPPGSAHSTLRQGPRNPMTSGEPAQLSALAPEPWMEKSLENRGNFMGNVPFF